MILHAAALSGIRNGDDENENDRLTDDDLITGGYGLLFSLFHPSCLETETSGEVIKIEAIPSGKDDIYLYQLIVSFDTGSGTVEGADACYMKKDDFSVGDHVTIRYNPDKPSVFYVVENHRYEYISKALITMIMAFPVLMQLIYYWMNK